MPLIDRHHGSIRLSWPLAAEAGRRSPSPVPGADALSRCRRRRLALEHGVDRRLGAFLAVGAGDAHGSYHLAIDRDGKRAWLWEIPHERRRQIFAAADDL